jgi:voltage-gated potassium channel Kch
VNRACIGRIERSPESSERGTCWEDANSPIVHVDVDKRFTQWYERLTLFRAVRTILAVAVLLVLLAGLVERLVEPDTFTSLGLSYWWAVTTVTTVGYGDIVPESPAGRVVGAMLMLLGISLIPTLTSVVVATLVGKRQRLQQEQIDRQGREHAEALKRIEERLAEISERIEGGPQGPG